MTKLYLNFLLLCLFSKNSGDVLIKIQNNGFFHAYLGVADASENPPYIDFVLPARNFTLFTVPNGWIGRIWTMTNCQESDGCDTGACEGYPEGPCLTPPEYPYTMALFTLADSTGFFQNDYYKVSAFGGFNCDIAISPIEGTFRHEINNPKFCQATTKCTRNLLIFCPDNLRWDGLWPLVGCLPGGSDDCNKSGDEGFEFYRHYCPTSYIDKCDERTSEFQCGGVDGPGTSAEYLVEIDCPPL